MTSTKYTRQQNQARYISATLPTLLERTAEFVADHVEAGVELNSIETKEIGDGSGRIASFVRLIDTASGSEWLWRITAPAGPTAPTWAQIYSTYATELIPSWL